MQCAAAAQNVPETVGAHHHAEVGGPPRYRDNLGLCSEAEGAEFPVADAASDLQAVVAVICINMSRYIHVYIYIYMYIFMNEHTHTHTHTYIFTYMYIYIAPPLNGIEIISGSAVRPRERSFRSPMQRVTCRRWWRVYI